MDKRQKGRPSRAALFYDYICWHAETFHQMPTLQEMADAVGVSKSNAHYNAHRLVDLGILAQPVPNRARGLQVVE